MAVTEGEFRAVVEDLTTNNDFFDPLYLTNAELYSPWTEDDVLNDIYFVETAKQINLGLDKVWDVIDFLQSYSDVDLVAMSAGRRTRSELINDWWKMYQSEKGI